MSDKTKFYRMTRPVRFRTIKLIGQTLCVTYEVGKERVKYLYYNLFSKLHIYKRFNYRTHEVEVHPFPKNFITRSVETSNFAGIVEMVFEEEHDINQDYFYKMKNGQKIIKYVLHDEDEKTLFGVAHLGDIKIKVANQWYNVNHLPTFKVNFYEPDVKPFNPDEPLKKVDYKVKTFDISKIQNARTRKLFGKMSVNDVSDRMVRYYYDVCCEEFLRYLGEISLNDIMM